MGYTARRQLSLVVFGICPWLGLGLLACPQPHYDYIVVGAGTAGCVLANRLSKDSSVSVLLLEHGVPMGPLNDPPSLQLLWMRYFDFTRKYRAKRSPNYCLSIENQQCRLPVGKAAGGGSAVNIMFYTRGNRGDYDSWVKHGAEGWGWDDVLPYFVSLEHYIGKQDPEDPNYGTLGERAVTYAVDDAYSAKASCLRDAGTRATMPYNENGQINLGFTEPLTTTEDGKRQDNYDAFIKPIENKRSNLKFLTKAFVKEIIFDNKTAIGVRYDLNFGLLTKQCKAYAGREVLLSAGTFGSAHLLMLSGVGPKSELEKFNIPVVSDLPVGKNLQDHLMTLSLNFITSRQNVLSLINPELLAYSELTVDVIRYLITQKGPVSVPSLVEMFGFVNISEPFLDTEFMLVPYTLAGPPIIQGKLAANIFHFTEETYINTYGPRLGVDGFIILPVLQHPYSRGSMTLYSTDPYEDPVIDINYYDDPRDMDLMIKAMRWLLDLTNNSYCPDLSPEWWDIPYYGCEDLEMWSDGYLECMARHSTSTFFHYVGTCKMGRASNDPTAVVDPQLRVLGVNNLRVIDASIMPTLITGHTQAPAQMIGAKGADLVLGKLPPPLRYV